MEYLQLPGLVRLFEYPAGENAKQRSKASAQSAAGYPKFRSCLRSILDSGHCLEGSEGNEIRVAIGSEARFAGFTLDEAVMLFQNVPDFDETISRNYLEYIYRGPYNRYRCDTLLDKAGSIILPYCRKCKLPWASENVKKHGGLGEGSIFKA
jgi:hypothetical protein